MHTGVLDKYLREILEGDIVELFGMRGVVAFECGAYGICFQELINYDLLESEIPFNNLPHFCYNDYFISLWELWWNFEQDDNPLYEVEIVGTVFDESEVMISVEENGKTNA